MSHTNDSIGTCSSELYIFYLLKLPAPPRATLLVFTLQIETSGTASCGTTGMKFALP